MITYIKGLVREINQDPCSIIVLANDIGYQINLPVFVYESIKLSNFKRSDNKIGYLYNITPQGMVEQSILAKVPGRTRISQASILGFFTAQPQKPKRPFTIFGLFLMVSAPMSQRRRTNYTKKFIQLFWRIKK